MNEPVVPDESVEQDSSSEKNEKPKEKGCSSSVNGVAYCISALGTVAFCCVRKKKDESNK